MDIFVLFKAALLGVVEGATEFIPVSSTGHLILVQDWLNFFGKKEDAFLIFIQLGAILAVVCQYRQKISNVFLNWRKDMSARQLVFNLILGTIPAVVIGLPTDDLIEKYLYNPVSVACALIVGGLLILVLERRKYEPRVTEIEQITPKLALSVGVIQVLAILFPGTSRSGATIIGGLMLGLSRPAATEFSFFLAIPAMFGASLIKLIKARDDIGASDIPWFAVGFIVAFGVALIVIRFLIKFVAKHSFTPFAWYRIVLGLIILGSAFLKR